MNGRLLRLDQLTREDTENERKYYEGRFLYNRYTEAQLKNWTEIDLYEALDLDGLRYSQIPSGVLKHVIRRKSALYHPIKNGGRNTAFILIQTAESVFSTPKYRKLYDSVVLDESIPEDREYSLDEFFDAFSPVFDRNGYFSEIQPVPRLSESVDVFYKFWNNFKTTRMYEDPEDVFEQRGAERRSNAEKKKDEIKKRKDQDAHRILRLVKLAYSRDPRIRRAPTAASSQWTENELTSLKRFNVLLGKHKDKHSEIAKKLNNLFLTKRTANDVKQKLESQWKN